MKKLTNLKTINIFYKNYYKQQNFTKILLKIEKLCKTLRFYLIMKNVCGLLNYRKFVMFL